MLCSNVATRKGVARTSLRTWRGPSILNALLDNCYTVNPRIPHFRFSRIFYDPPKEDAKDPEIEYEPENPYGEPLYNWSLGILVVYLIIALARTGYPSLAFLHCLGLLFLDQINSLVWRKATVNGHQATKFCYWFVGASSLWGQLRPCGY